MIISDQEEVKLSQLPTYREDIFIFVALRASEHSLSGQTDRPTRVGEGDMELSVRPFLILVE